MKKVLAIVLAGAMAMAMTACGSSSSTASSTTAATEAAATEAAADSASGIDQAIIDAALADSTLSDGVLTVGTNATFPPFEYVGSDGQPDGFDMALVKEAGKRLGVEVEIQDMEFDSLVAAIGSKIDISAAGMTVTEERKEAVDFTEAYYNATQCVLLPADSEVADAESLAQVKMGVQLGTTGALVASEISEENTVTYNSFAQAVMDLVNGKVQAVIIDTAPAAAYQAQYADQLKVLDGAQFDFESEEYAIACPKGDDALVAALNAAIDSMKADGTFDQLLDQYINNYEPAE